MSRRKDYVIDKRISLERQMLSKLLIRCYSVMAQPDKVLRRDVFNCISGGHCCAVGAFASRYNGATDEGAFRFKNEKKACFDAKRG